MTTATIIKENHLIGVVYIFRRWFIIMVGQGGMQVDMELEKELKVLYLNLQQEVDWDTGHNLSIGDHKAHLHSGTLPPTSPFLLQQSYTS